MHRASARLIVVAQLLLLLSLVGCARLGNPEGWSKGTVVGETLYIGTMEGDLRALDINTGDTIWTFELPGEDTQTRAIYGTPAVDVEGEMLYVGGYDGVLYALPLAPDETRGDVRQIWDVRVGGGDHIVGSPVVAQVGDRGVVLIGSSDGKLYAYDAADGTFQWSFPTGNKIWSTPAVANGIAYIGSLDHSLYAVNVTDGSDAWPSPFSAGGAFTATPLIARGRVYAGAFDGVFYAIDAQTGSEVRRFEEASKWYWGGAIAVEDTVFAPSLDGNVYALDIDTLELRWTLKADDAVIGSPAIVHDRIAAPSMDGRVRLVRLTDGADEQQCNIGEKLRSSLAVHDDVLYVSATDHSIRALRVKTNGNPDEEWVHFTDQEVSVPRDWVESC